MDAEMNPIDAGEINLSPNRVGEPAPAGAPSCRVVVLPDGKACGALATHKITWSDGDTTPACVDCASHMKALAQSHRGSIQVTNT